MKPASASDTATELPSAQPPHDLARSEAWFRSTFEHAAVGIAHVAPSGRFLAVNDRFCAIAGHSREALLAGGFQRITHASDLARDEAMVTDLLEGRIEHYAMEKRYLRGDGSVVWVMLTVGLVRDAQGKPAHFVSVIQDIDQRKAMEEAQARMHAQLEQAMRQLHRSEAEARQVAAELREAGKELRVAAVAFDSQDALAVTDDGCTLLRVNPALCALTGYDTPALVGRNAAVLLCDPRKEAVFGAGLQALLRQGRWQGEVDIRRRDGQHLPGWLSISAVTDDQGQASNYVVALADNTRRKRSQAALLRAQQDLARLSQQLMAREHDTTQRLAHLLNEDLGQILGAMALHIDLLGSADKAADGAPTGVQRHAAALSRLGRQAMDTLRSVLAELRPPLLQEQGLVAALQAELARRRLGAPGMELGLAAEAALQALRWPSEVEYAFFMAAREALDQLVQAQRVQCVMGGGRDWLRLQLRVEDGGLPNEPAHPAPSDWVCLRERALSVGARVDIRPSVHGGMCLQLEWERTGDDPDLLGR